LNSFTFMLFWDRLKYILWNCPCSVRYSRENRIVKIFAWVFILNALFNIELYIIVVVSVWRVGIIWRNFNCLRIRKFLSSIIISYSHAGIVVTHWLIIAYFIWIWYKNFFRLNLVIISIWIVIIMIKLENTVYLRRIIAWLTASIS